MKKSIYRLLGAKRLLVVLALLLTVGAWFLSQKVEVNYNITDYLGEETDTKIALRIMESEFSLTGSLQVMLSDISPEEALSVRGRLAEARHVLSVGFDAEDDGYYRDGKALFTLILDGDDYSENAKEAVADIRAAISADYPDAVYAGAAMEKHAMRNSVTGEIIYILVICIALAYLILVLTTNSWLEPVLFLLTAGVAVLLNKGTNLLFGEISYVTSSISAILQLALSMDYSIVLLHAFHRRAKDNPDHREAMAETVAACLKPISASALTTMAGLLSLLFMSFTIGIDIGLVLMKGIVISALVAFTLFPAVVLLFDRFLPRFRVFRRQKKALRDKGLLRFTRRNSRFVAPLAALLILASAIGGNMGTYLFAGANNDDPALTSAFGIRNTVVLVYDHTLCTEENQEAFLAAVAEMKKSDGSPILRGYTAYSNTAMQPYDRATLSKKFGLSAENADRLLALYRLSDQPTLCRLTPADFLRAAQALAEAGAAGEDEKIAALPGAVSRLLSPMTAEELCAVLRTVSLATDEQSVTLLYGLRGYAQIDDPTLPFREMLRTAVTAGTFSPQIRLLIGQSGLAALGSVSGAISSYENRMAEENSPAEFSAWAVENLGFTPEEALLDRLFAGAETARLSDLLTAAKEDAALPDTAKTMAEDALSLLSSFSANLPFDAFLPALGEAAEALGLGAIDTRLTDEAVQMLYITAFGAKKMLPETEMTGREFALYAEEIAAQNRFLNAQLTEARRAQLTSLIRLGDLFASADALPYPTLAASLREALPKGASFPLSAVAGVYLSVLPKEPEGSTYAVPAKKLLEFVLANTADGGLLAGRIDTATEAALRDATEQLARAESLFIGAKHTRVILSLDLPNEGRDSRTFAKNAEAALHEQFGENAHLGGEILSVNDLRDTFRHDRVLIGIFTVLSIFLIVTVIFRSLSAPLILVLIIQGSVWIAMSIFAVARFPIFFMCSIIADCILMGATIDYGILLTSEYIANRCLLDRPSALSSALRTAIPTIASSGSVLVSCGFVIRLVSGQFAISTTGLLLGVGTLVSVLMVIFVLPSVLYVCDRFLLRLTLRRP